MTPEEIKANIRAAINNMIKGTPEDQEEADRLIKTAIQQKSAAFVNPTSTTVETDLTDPTETAVESDLTEVE